MTFAVNYTDKFIEETCFNSTDMMVSRHNNDNLDYRCKCVNLDANDLHINLKRCNFSCVLLWNIRDRFPRGLLEKLLIQSSAQSKFRYSCCSHSWKKLIMFVSEGGTKELV